MIPVLSIIGKSNSGKTTFIEKLIPVLIKKGYRIATVKHDRSHGFDFDKEGKDSWRHKHAGATVTILSSPKMLALVRDVDKELTLNEIALRYADNTDLLIAEGYKEVDHDKIEIAADLAEEDLSCKNDNHVIALIADDKYSLDIPQFKRDDISEIAEWIMKKFLISANLRSIL